MELFKIIASIIPMWILILLGVSVIVVIVSFMDFIRTTNKFK